MASNRTPSDKWLFTSNAIVLWNQVKEPLITRITRDSSPLYSALVRLHSTYIPLKLCSAFHALMSKKWHLYWRRNSIRFVCRSAILVSLCGLWWQYLIAVSDSTLSLSVYRSQVSAVRAIGAIGDSMQVCHCMVSHSDPTDDSQSLALTFHGFIIEQLSHCWLVITENFKLFLA